MNSKRCSITLAVSCIYMTGMRSSIGSSTREQGFSSASKTSFGTGECGELAQYSEVRESICLYTRKSIGFSSLERSIRSASCASKRGCRRMSYHCVRCGRWSRLYDFSVLGRWSRLYNFSVLSRWSWLHDFSVLGN